MDRICPCPCGCRAVPYGQDRFFVVFDSARARKYNEWDCGYMCGRCTNDQHSVYEKALIAVALKEK